MSLQLEDEFQDIIKKARYGLGLSTEQVAQKVRCAEKRLQALEEGAALPSENEVRELAHALSLNGEALWNIAQGWVPSSPDTVTPYRVETFRFPEAQSNGYIVRHAEKNGVIVIDPGSMQEEFLQQCRLIADELRAILLTHTHADHIAALSELLSYAPHVPVVVQAAGKRQVSEQAHVTYVTEDQTMQYGEFTFKVLETPGHSPDGVVYVFDHIAFCGDTLFAGSLGRSQHGNETYAALLSSAQRILALPEHTILFPGHGPPTTVAEQKRNNAFIECNTT